MANIYSLDLEKDSSQYASIANASQTGLNLTDELTFEGWIKLETASAGISVPIVNKYAGGTVDSYVFYLYDSNLYFLNSYDGTNICSAHVAWTDSTGIWYHVAVTKTGTTVKFYVNGAQQGATQSLVNGTIYDGTVEFAIGHYTGQYFDGLIDEVRAWNIVRT